MKNLLLSAALLLLFSDLDFTYKDGATAGRSKVITLPAALFSPGVPQGQLLVFYPPGYFDPKNAKTKYNFMLFSAGDGEQVGLDVTLVNKNSLPRMIAAGLTPYSMHGTDTIYWIVASIHNNAGSAYRSQLTQILPWILDSSRLRIDPRHVWLSGLSGGGSATWASVMLGSALASRITGIMPMANGGYDDFLPTLQGNLIAAAKAGVYFFPYIGTQDPGYNGSGFFAYDALLRTYALPDHYHPHVIQNGTHSANVWDVPFNSRVIWDSLGLINYLPPTPPPNPVHARLVLDSAVIHYPNTSVVFADSSTGSTFSSWGAYAYPVGYPGRWSSYQSMSGMLLSNLAAGSYGVQLIASDGQGNSDTARAFIVVYGPPVCPVCPPSRTLTGINLVGGVYIPTYSDGKP